MREVRRGTYYDETSASEFSPAPFNPCATNNMAESPLVVILGCGWAGSRLKRQLLDSGYSRIISTLRNPPPEGSNIQLDLSDRNTWANLPDLTEALVIWTFPAKPLELVKEFYTDVLKGVKKIVVYSTASVYKVSVPNETIDETSELSGKLLSGESAEPQIQGEEFLRDKGAIILTLTGICGDERNPKTWIEKGYIRNGVQLVNLVHIDDIIATTIFFMTNQISGERYNVSYPKAFQWNEIASHYGFGPIQEQPVNERSKVISSEKLCSIFRKEFKSPLV